MARKLVSIPGLPQLPAEITGRDNVRDKFTVDELRVLWEWKRAIDALAEAAAAGGGHVIQDEGISLTQRTNLNFIGGAVTATDNAGTDTTDVTITTGTQNLFETIAVAGQSDIVADSTTDTLNVAAGSNITLTTDPTTDTLTIACTAGQIQGEQGPPGDEGPPGPPGEQGPPGVDGTVGFGGVIWLTMIGGGGGGGGTTALNKAGGGGGSGESCLGFQVYVTPGASYSYSVGAGGATDTDGGDTTFGQFTALGGKKGTADTGASGAGGGARGGAAQSPNNSGVVGTAETACYFGGSSGGTGNTAAGESGRGGGSGGYFSGGLSTSGAGGSGGGGAASPYGKGGAGSRTDGGAAPSTEYGAGGGGAGGQSGTTPNSGGAGCGGYILITYLGGSAEYTTGSGTWVAPSV